jgi:hypothetical protein
LPFFANIKNMEKDPLHLKMPELQISPEVDQAVERQEQRTGDVGLPAQAEPKPSFLEGYKVHEKPEAIRAAKKEESLTGETGIVTDKTKRIEAYLGRLENIFLNEDEDKRERNIALLKPTIYKNTLFGEDNLPDSYFEFQKQLARERGLGEVSFTEEQKGEERTKVIETQRLSLDSWIDYLTGGDCKYPADVKYFAMQGILKLGKFDTEKYSFARRNKATVAPFCEIDREALSTVLGALDAKHHDKDFSGYPPKLLALIDKKTSFGDMYAETMRDLDAKADKEKLSLITDGEWKVFEKGSNPQALVDSLAGKRSNLCIADIGQATRYLEAGSVEVFFSNNHAGRPVTPRIAVAFNEQGPYEVRGTANKNEDFDSIIAGTDTLLKRVKNLSNGEKFMISDTCMKRMTAIEKKVNGGQELTKDDLVFLYEINGTIEGFGYQKDPRIAELRQDRNPEEDMLVIFDCTKDQIAHVPSEIDENTKAYVGQLEPGLFQKLPENLEHIYTSFPEKPIRRENIEIGGKSAKQLIAEMEAARIKISDSAKYMLESREFVPGKNPEETTLIRLTVADLGFKTSTPINQIYDRAQTLGLELCSADTGPHYRLKYQNQPLNEWIYMGMKQITGSHGHPGVFTPECRDDGLWLNDDWAKLDDGWHPHHQFVFRLHKTES